MGEWQPIETAPKDGTAIVIYEPSGHYGRIQNTYMPESALKEGECTYFETDPRLLRFDDTRYAIGCWTPYGKWSNRNCADVNPTHWMPLPEPPK